MTCEECELAVSAFCDGEGGGSEGASMFVHLQGCRLCRVFFKKVMQMKSDALREERMHPPQRLDTRILGRGEWRFAGRSAWISIRHIATAKIALPVPVAAVVVMALLVGGSFLLGHPDKQAASDRVPVVQNQSGMSLPVIRISK
jgi:hypothetical protein